MKNHVAFPHFAGSHVLVGHLGAFCLAGQRVICVAVLVDS